MGSEGVFSVYRAQHFGLQETGVLGLWHVSVRSIIFEAELVTEKTQRDDGAELQNTAWRSPAGPSLSL